MQSILIELLDGFSDHFQVTVLFKPIIFGSALNLHRDFLGFDGCLDELIEGTFSNQIHVVISVFLAEFLFDPHQCLTRIQENRALFLILHTLAALLHFHRWLPQAQLIASLVFCILCLNSALFYSPHFLR